MKRNNISELELTKIAEVIKTHGYKGGLLLRFNLDFERIIETELFFVKIDGIIIPFFISDNKIHPRKKQTAFVKFDEINTEEGAKDLISYSVYTEQKNITEQKKDIIEELSGFEVYDNDVFIGIAVEYMQIPSNPILRVNSLQNSEILIPFSKHFLIEIKETEKKIFFKLPEGLIDINK